MTRKPHKMWLVLPQSALEQPSHSVRPCRPNIDAIRPIHSIDSTEIHHTILCRSIKRDDDKRRNTRNGLPLP